MAEPGNRVRQSSAQEHVGDGCSWAALAVMNSRCVLWWETHSPCSANTLSTGFEPQCLLWCFYGAKRGLGEQKANGGWRADWLL